MSEPKKWGELSKVLLAQGENELMVQGEQKSVLAWLQQREKGLFAPEVLRSQMFDLIIICDTQRSFPSPGFSSLLVPACLERSFQKRPHPSERGDPGFCTVYK